MKSIIFIFIIVFVIGCGSNENLVSVKQTQNDSPVILRIRKDRTSIHSLLYPLSFMIKKTDKRDIYYLDNTFLFHNITLSSGTGGCYLTPLDKNKNLSISYKIFNGVIKLEFNL